MKIQLKRNFAYSCLIILAILLSGCQTNNDSQTLNSGRTSSEKIQEQLRFHILSKYEDKTEAPIVIAEPIQPKIEPNANKEVSPELAAWRKNINSSWATIKTHQFGIVCDLFYKAIIDKDAQFANVFENTRKGLEAQGTSIYSIKGARLKSDNRETIQFPTKEYSSSLFVCEATLVLKLTNGVMTDPLQSTIGWNYYLENDEIKWTISFNVKG